MYSSSIKHDHIITPYFTYLLAIVVAFASTKAYSNDGFEPLGARSSGLGGASVSLSDEWSAGNNQAGLASLTKLSAAVFYSNPYFINTLSTTAGTLLLPTKHGTIGLLITNFGYKLYHENKYALSFSKSFGNNLSIGLSFDYLNTRIADSYGNKNNFIGELGVISKPVKNLSIGAHIYNPTLASFKNYNSEKLPTIIKIGAHYNFSEKLLVIIETEKDIDKPAIYKSGIEYQPSDLLTLRMGLNSIALLSSFGIGININHLTINISSHHHPTLGFSPQIGLIFSSSSKGNE